MYSAGWRQEGHSCLIDSCQADLERHAQPRQLAEAAQGRGRTWQGALPLAFSRKVVQQLLRARVQRRHAAIGVGCRCVLPSHRHLRRNERGGRSGRWLERMQSENTGVGHSKVHHAPVV